MLNDNITIFVMATHVANSCISRSVRKHISLYLKRYSNLQFVLLYSSTDAK